MIQRIIRVKPDTPEDMLDAKSFVDFSKAYRVEYYQKVNLLGRVVYDSILTLLSLRPKYVEESLTGTGV